MIVLHFLLLMTSQLINLESTVQDFVLETKRIEIPDYPTAFNPSIVRWQGKLLMSFRVIPDPKTPFTSWIGLVWLDEQFQPISLPQKLQLRDPASEVPSRAEDARLLMVGHRLYIIYSDNPELKISRGGFRMYLAEVQFDGKRFFLHHMERLCSFDGENKNRREKNWVPFNYRDQLLLAYSIDPHLIFYPYLGSEECVTIASTQPFLNWDWGELRGGTPALEDERSGDYLAFFHSSKKMATVHSEGKTIDHYFIGAYTFSRHSPFGLTRISPRPIVGKEFYQKTPYKGHWKPVKVVFPGGYIFDGKFIWLAYGKDDHEIWVAKLDREGLLKSMVSISGL